MMQTFKIFRASGLQVSFVSNQLLLTLCGTLLEPMGDARFEIPNFENIALIIHIKQITI
jgi:hypothetical protein